MAYDVSLRRGTEVSTPGNHQPGPFTKELRERSKRRAVNLPGQAILQGGSTTSVTLLDLSYDGCCIEIGEELRPGEQIKLAVLASGVIDAEVRWYSRGKAGLVFNAVTSEDEPPIWCERGERVPVSASVSARRQGKLNHKVSVLDASPGGCKIEFIDCPMIGDRVWIKFDGLESMEAQVRWIDGASAGLQFARPIHPAVFELLVHRMG